MDEVVLNANGPSRAGTHAIPPLMCSERAAPTSLCALMNPIGSVLPRASTS
jgi:hypothetical protein